MKLPISGLILLFLFTLDCSAQSLADAARKERERQSQVRSVITIKGVTTSSSAGTATAGATPAEAPTPAAASKPAGPTDNQGRDEKYWRGAFLKARDDIKRADEKISLLDAKVRDLNTQMLRQDDIYNKENRLGPQIADTQKQLDDARKEAAAARQRIPDLEEELRKAGGLPGWAR